MTDRYYNILGVDKNASKNDIKQAYRKLAKKYHPDMHTDKDKKVQEQFVEKFKQINEANDVLSNEQKRRTYDTQNVNNIMSFFNKPFGMHHKHRQRRPKKLKYIAHKIRVSLDEFYCGVTKKVSIKRQIICGECKGKGGTDVTICNICHGKGMFMKTSRMGANMIIQQPSKCHKCEGVGNCIFEDNKCKKCKSLGHVLESITIEVEIPKGTLPGHKFMFEGRGHQQLNHLPGDIIVIVTELKHSVFKRRRHCDLYAEKNITLMNALLGIDFELDFLNDEHIRVAFDGVISPNKILCLKSKGLPINKKGTKFGDLFVKFTVMFPKKISTKQKKALVGLGFSHKPPSKNERKVHYFIENS